MVASGARQERNRRKKYNQVLIKCRDTADGPIIGAGLAGSVSVGERLVSGSVLAASDVAPANRCST